jgi:hypothetical protein
LIHLLAGIVPEMIDRIAIVLRFQKALDESNCPALCRQIFDGKIFVSVRFWISHMQFIRSGRLMKPVFLFVTT